MCLTKYILRKIKLYIFNLGGILKIDYGITKYATENNIEANRIYRIVSRTKNYFKLVDENNFETKIYISENNDKYIIGDFVEIIEYNGENIILRNYERNSLITKASSTVKKSYAHNEEEQNIAANVDQLFILIASDQRFTLSKFERYLLTFNNMVKDIKVIISKSDHIEKARIIQSEINSIYPNVIIFFSSISDSEMMEKIKELFNENETAALVGSSGVGKSTLINYLISNHEIDTNEVRSDGKGKHTTTSSSIYYAQKTNSYIIDTPGFKTISTNREINDDILFESINILSSRCKFRNCKHQTEPGCAVNKAINDGEISHELYQRYLLAKEKNFKYETFLMKKEKRKINKLK